MIGHNYNGFEFSTDTTKVYEWSDLLAIFDANEDGKFEKASDVTALRVGLIGSPAKNGDVNKDGKINICDLVKLSGK